MSFKIEGLMVPAITPKTESAPDLIGLANLMEFLIKGRADSIFIIGTSGEFQYLSLEQKQQIIEHSAKCIGQRIPLLVGVSSHTITETLQLIELAKDQKVQAIVLAPMFGSSKPAEQIDAILHKSSLPVLLYNNPVIHGNETLPVSMVKKYASNPEVIGIKDSSGDWTYFNELLKLQTENFSVLQGRESQILASLKAGADGIVAGAANINPEPFSDILISPNEAIMDEIIRLKNDLKELSKNSISALKQKLVQTGIIGSSEMFG